MITNQPSPPVYFLLVDDLDENLQALEALLRRDGLCLLKAQSGAAALELLLQYEIALALIDVQMPGMDGFMLAELMRGTDRTRRVPIIFLTAGDADRQRRFHGYEKGAVDFLHKPIEPDVLKGKAEVFFELNRRQLEIARQRDELRLANEENKRLLAESRQYAQALQESDRRKDEYLAILGHELRNPLAPIYNAIQVLKLLSQPDPEVQELQDIIERQTNHLIRLIDDLLDIRRISEGKLELRQTPINLVDVVHSAIETSRPLIDRSQHDLRADLPQQPVMVQGDLVRLTQVVSNLLNNAAKYTGDNGHISVRVARDGANALIQVRDDGMGIPTAMLPHVFDMFMQVRGHLDHAQGGLGIGLSLVKRLVEMHGGTISAHSGGENQGSEFTIRLPAI